MERSNSTVMGSEVPDDKMAKMIHDHLPEILLEMNKKIYKVLKKKDFDEMVDMACEINDTIGEVMENLVKAGVIDADEEDEMSSVEEIDSEEEFARLMEEAAAKEPAHKHKDPEE